MNFFNKFNNLKNKNLKTNITKILSITTFGLLFIIMGSSYAYLTSSTSSTLINTVSSGNLELKLNNETSTLSLNKAVPQLDDDALESNNEYTFTLSNTGDILTHYEIYLNNICSTSEVYTVNGSTIKPDLCVDEKYINIGVKEETGDYTIVNFENGKAILDIGELSLNEEKNYTVKIWLDVDTPNEYNAYLNGVERNILFVSKINITGEQRGNANSAKKEDSFREVTPSKCFGTSNNIITNYYCYDGNENNYETITDVVIPEVIDGSTITTLANEVFLNKGLTSIDLPNTITTIGTKALRENNLTSLILPDSVTTIGEYAFAKNKLTSVSLSNNVTTLPLGVFWDNKIENITLPNSLLSIEKFAFMTNSLKSITIPNSVTTIGVQAFMGNNLTSVNLGNGLTTIEKWAFDNNSITSVTIPNSVTTIGEYAFYENDITSVTLSNNLTTIATGIFSKNKINSITIPEGITSIGTYAFSNNNLTELVIPNSVITIDYHAFALNNLTYVLIKEGSNLTETTGLGSSAFSTSGYDHTLTIYNNSGKSFKWYYVTQNISNTESFITGSIDSYSSVTTGTTYGPVLVTTGSPS